MTRVEELSQQEKSLSTREKAQLAATLLASLPPVLDDDDGGVAEAQRRDAELEKGATAAISWDQLRKSVGR